MIDQNSIEQLKSRLDISEVLSHYIELKKHGTTLKALCPFHPEKTPSLVVSPSKGVFKCFGCGKGGDAISFVMEIEHLNYAEAVEKIASMYNFSLRYTDEKREKKANQKLLESVNEFYKKRLLSQGDALSYLKSRGVKESEIERFELGFAPSAKESIDFIESQHIPKDEALELGVLGSDGERLYPRLIERITFPIYAPNGKLVGFGGRTISNHPAKYINSPETPLFKKSKLLYGYKNAKDAIFKKRELIITEGYLDVLMLHQAGFDTATATLGTALTKEHIPLLKKGEPRIIIAYDGDMAGVEAAFKASTLLVESGILEGGVVIFGGGADPADMVASGRLEELKKLFAKPKPFIAFCLEKICYEYDLKIPEKKNRALNEATAFLSILPQILQDEYRGYLANILKIEPRIIKTKKTKDAKEQKEELQKEPNLKERRIIKSILEKPTLLEFVLEFVDSECFLDYVDEFVLLKKGVYEDERLQRVYLDEKTKPYTESELKEELRLLIIRAYTHEIDLLNKNEKLDIKTKFFWINNRHQKILELKKGVLASYESCSVI